MKTILLKNPKFVKSAVKASGYPTLKDTNGDSLPEVAVAGRSNVGKSSLLNNLFQVKGLVKTSATPGKTQLLNFFDVNEQVVFVDLPGYGFAKVPPAVKKQWGPMVQTYLNDRENLKLVLCLLDIRRIPNEEDLQMLDWAVQAEKSVILVLTKVDKVGSNDKKKNTDKILKAFPYENLQYVHYSATKNVGRKELTGMIREALSEE